MSPGPGMLMMLHAGWLSGDNKYCHVFFLGTAKVDLCQKEESRHLNLTNLVTSVVALVTDSDEGAWTNVGIADDAAAVALLTETPDGDTGLLAAEDQVGMMLGHRQTSRKLSHKTGFNENSRTETCICTRELICKLKV